MAKKKVRGPRGGVKHQPGRGHDSKSGPLRKKRFAEKKARERAERQQEARAQWAFWDGLTDEQRKLLPDREPTLPRPSDEDDRTSNAH